DHLASGLLSLFNQGNSRGYRKTVANVKAEKSDITESIHRATLQLENLLKLVGGNSRTNNEKRK
ncbi:hypothetical protein KSS87_015702, partial [Heliosperma pusillum]